MGREAERRGAVLACALVVREARKTGQRPERRRPRARQQRGQRPRVPTRVDLVGAARAEEVLRAVRDCGRREKRERKQSK